MPSLSAAELSDMRTAIESLLPGTCHILSGTQTPDGQGGHTEAWGTATANVSCRLDSYAGVGNKEAISGAALQAFHGYILTIPYDTTIAVANRVKLDSDTFSVVSVDDGKSWDTCRRCYLERI